MLFRKRKRPAAPIVHAGDEDFDAVISGRAGVAVVDFWAPWCGPCRMMEPILEDVALAHADGGATVVKVNIDEAPKTAESYEVRSIPTLIFFKDGEPQFEMVGLVPQPVLEREIAALRSPEYGGPPS